MKTVLVIGAVWPEPNSTAAGSRMLQILDFFLYHNYKVIFACAAAPNSESQFLDTKNIETRQIRLNHSQFDDFLKKIHPEIVVYDRFIIEEQYSWRVHKFCPDALSILDTEDLHFLREFRRLRIKNETDIHIQQLEITKREIASIYRCDLSFIISEEEVKLLKSQFHIPEQLLFYLPFLLERISPSDFSSLPSYKERRDFICVGNFRHAPNNDAVKYLKEKIWPEIHRALPETKMKVFGAYSNSGDLQLQEPRLNFYIKGYIPDIHLEMAQSRVQLAPLRFGAGLKGKFISGMLAGTPAITTTLGAEGINGKLPWNGYVQNETQDFARAAIELYSNEEKWNQAQQNGTTILATRFNKFLYYPLLEEKIEHSLANLSNLRVRNFVGAMLLHHRNKSTYYLSKYIETKSILQNFQKNQEL